MVKWNQFTNIHNVDEFFELNFNEEKKECSDSNTPLARMRQLEKLLSEHDLAYYRDGKPTVSDYAYDQLYRELETLESTHPKERSAHSPTQRVGNDLLEAFITRPHLRPMLSIDDVFSQKELAEFWKRLEKSLPNQRLNCTIEPKIDGVAATLIYRKGKLDYALTRGDGKNGDDITENVKTIRNLPLTLNTSNPPALIEIRGEIYMEHKGFTELNQYREAEGLPTFANPRNCTAGTIKQLDSREVAKRPLSFLAHGLGELDGIAFDDEKNFRDSLNDWGIPSNKPLLEADNFKDLWERITQLDQLRHELPHLTDGAVVKLTNHTIRQELGATARAPRWAAAFKFPPEQKETTVESITIQVGRTGALTPVANLAPVYVSGTTVARATLHNQDEIDRKDVRVGDTVVIEKAGEIIPSVVRIITSKRPNNAKAFSIFDHLKGICPACGHPIKQAEGHVAWRCVNVACKAKAADRISHFASRKALDIDALGSIVSESLVNQELVKTPTDLYRLDIEILTTLNLGTEEKPRMFGEKNATKLLNSLEKAKAAPLNRWIYGLGIPNVGESGASELARLHETIIEIAQSPLVARLASFEKAGQKQKDEFLAPYEISGDLGTISSKAVLTYFESQDGLHFLKDCQEFAINPKSDNYRPKPSEGKNLPLQGQTIVITGSFDVSRNEIKKYIQSLGATVSGSISSKTTLLIAGEGGGSKRTKAENLEVKIQDFATAAEIKAYFED